ncbi:MAG TPA: FtsQ-type POTRA domain-containing protein [bacterium]|jgi:cell division protein FtsQ|nr:FtsQ-type POTRA domain-containing protein [bacterium]
MHYQGTKVPLSEKNTRFQSAGIPARRPWGNRTSATESHRPKREEKQFSLKMFMSASKPEMKPVGTNYAFYRPGATTTTELPVRDKAEGEKKSFWGKRSLNTPSFSKTEKSWSIPAPSSKNLKPVVFVSVLLLLVVAGFWIKQRAMGALENSEGLKLGKVMIEGEHYLTEAEILKTANLSLGSSMFKVDLEDLNQKLKKLSWVDRVFVERRLPSSILISIRERKPVALVDNGSIYGVDKEGRVLSPSESLLNQDLPLISGVRFSPDSLGTTESAQILKPALDFFTFMAKKDDVLAHDVSEVNLSEPESLKVTFINGTQVTFNTTVSESDLKRMALVLGDLNEKGKKAGTMDFRYRDMAFVRTR